MDGNVKTDVINLISVKT